MNEERPCAIVTGASGGIGGACVRELSATHLVLAVGRNREALEALSAETGCRVHPLDLADVDDLADVADAVGRVDVLVHAAAVAQALGVADASAEDWRRHLDTDVVAPALLTRALLPMLRAASGTVVFIGSGASTRPVPGSAVYTAAKHALKGVADVLRIDEEPSRVRVVTVSPGQTDTPMLRASVAAGGGTYEPDRYIRAESIAQTVRFAVDAPPDVHLTDIAARPRVEIARI
ncbi:SDR family oxidoreductase [Microbacterium karelineae]|uniref:SDR family oxidoreductase n=1 Tax=Microbacterium karelineae TaxID=2654283 RepID=UPI001E5CFCFE|nr:SDR family oxidoreductase [Microbacterium karelineae]